MSTFRPLRVIRVKGGMLFSGMSSIVVRLHVFQRCKLLVGIATRTGVRAELGGKVVVGQVRNEIVDFLERQFVAFG